MTFLPQNPLRTSVLAIAIASVCWASQAFAATISNQAVAYSSTDKQITVSGNASGASGVAITVFDSTGTIKLFATAPVDANGAFSYNSANSSNTGGAIVVNLNDGTYTVKLADYEGGAVASTSLVVDTTSSTTTPAATTTTTATSTATTATNPATGDIPLMTYVALVALSAGTLFIIARRKTLARK